MKDIFVQLVPDTVRDTNYKQHVLAVTGDDNDSYEVIMGKVFIPY